MARDNTNLRLSDQKFNNTGLISAGGDELNRRSGCDEPQHVAKVAEPIINRLRRKLANGNYHEYTADELAIFDACREHRAEVRPQACNGGECCWVELGPPAFTKKREGRCLGCGGAPRSLGIRDR